jgi:tetrahydromethanopterin S-methyltransferase subunit G
MEEVAMKKKRRVLSFAERHARLDELERREEQKQEVEAAKAEYAALRKKLDGLEAELAAMREDFKIRFGMKLMVFEDKAEVGA